MNLGSRRLVASDDFRNTTQGYTGLRADLTSRRQERSATLYYMLPQERRPDDFASLRDNEIQLDHESRDLQLFGALAAQAGLARRADGGVRLREASWKHDAPRRATRNRELHDSSARG